MQIQLSEEQSAFVEVAVKDGWVDTPEQLLDEAIDIWRQREAVRRLEKLLEEAEKSGFSDKPFVASEYIEKWRAKYGVQ